VLAVGGPRVRGLRSITWIRADLRWRQTAYRPVTCRLVTTDGAALAAVLRTESGRLCQLLAAGADVGRPVPGLDWTVAEVAAHLLSVYGVFGSAVAGEDVSSLFAETPDSAALAERIAAVNDFAVARLTVDDPVEASAALAAAADRLASAIEAHPDLAQTIATPWYGSTTTHEVATVAALAGSETLVHTLDIARGLGVRHRLSAASAAVVTPIVFAKMLPYTVDPRAARGVTVRYEVRLRGAARLRVAIEDGVATAGPAGSGPIDCVLSVTPTAALLTGFGRRPVWRAVVAGQSFAYGRKPWLGPQFPHFFRHP
jgi:uncharacterized protein (TIGR03083 family)